MGWAHDPLTDSGGRNWPSDTTATFSLRFPHLDSLSLVPRFSASDSLAFCSLNVSASWVSRSPSHYLSSECVSALLPCVSLQISPDLISTPILLLGPPQISGLRGPQSQLKGERAASVSRGHKRRLVLERFGKSVPGSQVLTRWAASLCLPLCLGRGRSARAEASRGRGLASLWPLLPPRGSQAPPRSIPIGLGRPRP